MSLVTDSTPVAEPKPTKGSTLHALLKLFTPKAEWSETKKKFTEGGTGYGDLKKLLLARVLDTFRAARERRAELEKNPDAVRDVLRRGHERAMPAITQVMDDCRKACGLGW
jgi:tryptophanyl-tRNA synthetase